MSELRKRFSPNVQEWISDPDKLVNLDPYYHEILMKDRNGCLRHAIGCIMPNPGAQYINPATRVTRQYMFRSLVHNEQANRLWAVDNITASKTFFGACIVAARRLNVEEATAAQTLLSQPSYRNGLTTQRGSV